MSAPGERRGGRLGTAAAAAALVLVALVAFARYYAAGMHPVWFNPELAGTLVRYLARDYGGASDGLRAYFTARSGGEAQDDFYRAGLLFERNQPEEALKALRTLIAAAPEKPIDALALAAIIETRLGRHDEAIATWQHALRYGEAGPRLYVYVTALDTVARLLREPAQPGHHQALLAQLFCYLDYFDRGKARTARRHARAAIAAGDHAAQSWIVLGILRSRAHDADAALAAFEQAALVDPKNGDAHYYLAREHSDRGDLAGELRSGLAGYAADPDGQTAQWVLELLNAKFGDYRKVLAIGQERLAAGRREHGVLFELGRAYGALGDHPAAIGAYASALELAPNDVRTMAQLAYWNARAGHRAEAIAVARRAAEIRPDWGYPLKVVARALAEDFHYEEAIPAYEQSFAIERPAADELAHLCTLYHGTSRWQKGLECFQAVLSRDPNNARAQRMIGEARANLALDLKRQAAEKR